MKSLIIRIVGVCTIVIISIVALSCPGPIDLYDKVEEVVDASRENGKIEKPSAAPSDLTADVISVNQIDLAWKDKSDNEDGFELQVKYGSNYQRLQEVEANCEKYTHIGLNQGTVYTYRVRAINSGGVSDWSSEVAATTPNEQYAASKNATLDTLQLSTGSLDEDFSPWVTEYHASVVYEDNPIAITVFPSHEMSTIEINGETVVSGHPHDITLNVGSNNVQIVVTAEAGNTLTYTVEIIRKSDSTLSVLEIYGLPLNGEGSASLFPVFSPTTDKYYVRMNSEETEIGITTAVADPQNAAISINGSLAESGVKKQYTTDHGANNAFTIQVSSGDGATAHTRTYEISVYVPLANLAITGQQTSYREGDDGDHQAGMNWNYHTINNRFVHTNVGENWYTVDDRFTGLRWAHPATPVSHSWNDALTYAQNITVGTAAEGGWRLPNVHELESLINYNESTTDWLPLDVVEPDLYWTSTVIQTSSYIIHMETGNITNSYRGYSHNILLVKEIGS